MKSRHVLLLLPAAALLAVVMLSVRWHRQHAVPPSGEPRLVQTMPVAIRDVPVYVDAIGTVTPTHTVVVHAQIGGTLTSVRFHEGQMVKAGDVLATIDDRALKAQVMASQGVLERDRALLANARIDLQRDRGLLKIGSATQQQLDTQLALVQQYAGTVKADQGSLANLQVQLGFTRVIAPIDGVVGLRAVDGGNVVQPGDAAGIATLTTLSPMTVKFAVPEDDLDRIVTAMSRISGGGHLPVQVFSRTGSDLLAKGQLDALDNRIDSSTGTVMARASFANADRRLFPNQFVNVRALAGVLTQADLVPTRAVQHGADGDYIYVAVDGKAMMSKIVTGPVDGDDTVVLNDDSGMLGEPLNPGDAVITEGADALDDGVAVKTNAAKPATAASSR